MPKPAMFFRRHALRRRRFLVIHGRYVHAVDGLLARWRCPFCQRTFTEYPPFALPFRRYAVSQLAPRALTYVEDDGVSYRKAVLETHLPIFHWRNPVTDATAHEGDVPVLAHTTLYRWVSAFGTRTRPIPMAGRSDETFMPAAWKFQTAARRNVLLACRLRCLALSPAA
jgi:hypothetical protein